MHLSLKLAVVICLAPFCNTRIVSTKSGLVLGKEICERGSCVEAYLGIPFAEAPVGPLRFKKPTSKRRWRELLVARQMAKPCFQRRGKVPPIVWQGDETMSREDCLYLNVWVPKDRPSSTSLPVMVWIHGGSYRIGSTDLDMYNGLMLSAYGKVVIVSMSYRLGALGFLNGNVADIPGNMGLWDQYLALRWVSENIFSFSGDPSSVTLFGQSTGSASTAMLAQSPLCRGLFRRVILQSGTSMWPIPLENEGALQRALGLSRKVGCLQRNVSALNHETIRCLQRVPAEEIARAELELFDDHHFTFAPSFGDELVPENPVSASKEGKILPVDLLLGCNELEGSILFFLGNEEGLPRNWTSAGFDMNAAKQFLSRLFRAFPQPIVENVTAQYLPNPPYTSEELFLRMATVAGDFLLQCPAALFADILADRLNRIWLYKFRHRPMDSPWPLEFDTSHTDEIQFVFGAPLRHPEIYSRSDARMSEAMMLAWATFAHTG